MSHFRKAGAPRSSRKYLGSPSPAVYPPEVTIGDGHRAPKAGGDMPLVWLRPAAQG